MQRTRIPVGRLTIMGGGGGFGGPGRPGFADPGYPSIDIARRSNPLRAGGGGGPAIFPPPRTGGGGNWYDPIVERGADWLGRRLFGGGNRPGAGTGASTPGEGQGGCPQGYEWDPRSGRCEQVGLGGLGRRLVPGGATGTLEDRYGEAVLGAFGTPAIVPAQVGTITDRAGNPSPIFRCPPGAVLGKDNLCYMKGSIPRQFRKWKPSPKPPMSAADAKALRRIGTLQKKVKRLAGNAGLSCRKR